MLSMIERIEIAYKKLKASVYFDKTQLPLRDRITTYEDRKIVEKLSHIADVLNGSDEQWQTYMEDRLATVGAFLFPKKLHAISKDMIIFNSDSIPITMEAPQYFLDLDVEGHILGTLWVLAIGWHLDQNTDGKTEGMYEHSYGNRLKANLYHAETGDITFSPHLFKPYFGQYESWRDYGLSQAKERLKDQQDVLILTLDFKSFYYSVDLQESDFAEFLGRLEEPEPWQSRINSFVYQVLRNYSEKLRTACIGTDFTIGERTVLPIGFLPSNILSNWVLTPFDNAVISHWNPVYYGRYVDDIIIVDKVESNNPLYKLARSTSEAGQLTPEEIMNRFLCCEKREGTGTTQVPVLTAKRDGKAIISYRITDGILKSLKSDVQVQNEKVKVFYFQSGATKALLDTFRTRIARNASEFRMMPELDEVLRRKNYSEIFNLKSSDTIHKLRSVDGMEIDKFALSKFLGKYCKVGVLINGREETAFERDLMMILDERTLIQNYLLWERVFEILIINGRMNLYKKVAFRILRALERYEVSEDAWGTAAKTSAKEGLLRVFRAAVCRTAALCWDREIEQVLKKMFDMLQSGMGEGWPSPALIHDFEPSAMLQTRYAYLQTRMVNKYVIPLLIDCILPKLVIDKMHSIHLYNLTQLRALLDPEWQKETYRYYPYMVKPEEISFALQCTDMANGITDFNPETREDTLSALFLRLNYPNISKDYYKEHRIYNLDEVESKEIKHVGPAKGQFTTKVGKRDGSDNWDKLRAAVGAAQLYESDFQQALDSRPNRSYERYRHLSKLIDDAIRQKVNLLVLPESYVPFEWLPTLIRICANNGLALITGIEHVLVKAGQEDLVYNLTATILPYEHQRQKFAHVSYHNKTAYSPEEQRQIMGYGYTYREGSSHELFCWHGIWFPVYCCFELASIQARACFRFYADLVVAVEWNSDIPYFSNIIESLSRDLHCFCIQVNSSGPGDSRILFPGKSEVRDLIQVKGGDNPCILAAELNVKKLRDFQRLGYLLQKGDRTFKPTPPKFDREILEHKRGNTLFEELTTPCP